MQTAETQPTQAENLDLENPEGVVFNPDDFRKPEEINPERPSAQETPDQIVNIAGNTLGQEYSILHLPDSNFSGRYDEETDDIHYEHNNTTLKTFNPGGKEDYNALIRELTSEGLALRKSEDEKYATAWVYDRATGEVRSYVLKATPKPNFEYGFGNEDDYTADSETDREQITLNITELFKTEESRVLQAEQKAESFFSVSSLVSVFTNKEKEVVAPVEANPVEAVKNIFTEKPKAEVGHEPEHVWKKLIQVIFEEPKPIEIPSVKTEEPKPIVAPYIKMEVLREEVKAEVKQEAKQAIITQSVELKEVAPISPRTESSKKDTPVEKKHIYPEIVEKVHSQKEESAQPQTAESIKAVVEEETGGIEEVKSMVTKEKSDSKEEVIKQRPNIQTPEAVVVATQEPAVELTPKTQDSSKSTEVSIKVSPSINQTPEAKVDSAVDIAQILKQEVVEVIRTIETIPNQVVIGPDMLTEEIPQVAKLEESVKMQEPRKIEDAAPKREAPKVVMEEIVELETSESTETQTIDFEEQTESIEQQATDHIFEEVVISEQYITRVDEEYGILDVLDQETEPPIEIPSKELILEVIPKTVVPEANTTPTQTKAISIKETLVQAKPHLPPQVFKEEVVVKKEEVLIQSNKDIKSPNSEDVTQEIFTSSFVSLQVEDKPKKILEVKSEKEKITNTPRVFQKQENFQRRFSGVGDIQQESFATVSSQALDPNLIAEVSS